MSRVRELIVRCHAQPVLPAALLLTLLGFAAFGNTLPNPFLTDDNGIILLNPRVVQGDLLGSFTSEYWPIVEKMRLYRPLVVASFALQWPLSQEAWTFRLVNLLLHAATALFVFLLGRELTGRTGAALLAAAIFACHPIHTSTLNPIIGRADILAGLAVLGAAWLYQRDAARTDRAGIVQPLLAGLLFAVGLLSKENAITLIGVVALLDAARLGRGPGWTDRAWLARRVLRCYLPLVLIAAGFLWLKVAVVGGLGPERGDISAVDNIIAGKDPGTGPAEHPLLLRWGTPLAVLAQAGGLLIWPHPLSWDYSYAAIPPVQAWTDRRLWAGAALLCGALLALAASWFRRRQVFVTLGLALATYSVVSNLPVVIGAIFAERFLYLPAAGIFLMLALLADAGWRARPGLPLSAARTMFGAAVGVLLLGLLALSYSRNLDFRTPERLNAVDLAKHPRSVRLLCAVAGDRMKLQDFSGGLALANEALALAPGHWPAWRAAGYAHLFMNNQNEALACMMRAITSGGGRDEMSSVVAANIHAARGELPQAQRILEALVERNSETPAAHNLLARVLVMQFSDDREVLRRALPLAERAFRLRPQAGLYLDTCAELLQALGDGPAARRLIELHLPGVAPEDPYRAGLLARLRQM